MMRVFGFRVEPDIRYRPQGMILAWKRANRREKIAYENRRYVAIGLKFVVLPNKLSHTSSCFCRLAMPFKSFATLGTVPPNAEIGTATVHV